MKHFKWLARPVWRKDLGAIQGFCTVSEAEVYAARLRDMGIPCIVIEAKKSRTNQTGDML